MIPFGYADIFNLFWGSNRNLALIKVNEHEVLLLMVLNP